MTKNKKFVEQSPIIIRKISNCPKRNYVRNINAMRKGKIKFFNNECCNRSFVDNRITLIKFIGS